MPTPGEYRRRIRAWTLYDWANSAFATVILVSVFPVYYAKVACSGLPGVATATRYWSTTTSVSLLIVALIAPVLGTVADVMRGKKLFLAIFLGVGVVFTGLLVLVGTGDWLLASVIFVFGRVGFAAANVFYDSLLPHVAREEDRDRVSTRGYAVGYLGGGVLLAANVVAIHFLTDALGTWAPRLCFLSVALWWGVFSIPLLRRVPEPPATPREPGSGRGAIRESIARLVGTLKRIREYRQLFRFLVAFLIYNDGIGTIISAAVIYGAELGFEPMKLVLAVLLVQFAGIPFSLVFGRIATRGVTGRARCLGFVLANVVLLPLTGVAGARLLPPALRGGLPGIFGALVAVQLAASAFAFGPGRRLLRGIAGRMDAKRSLLLALSAYAIIALWGFALQHVMEFWFLAFLIAVVQGGSQALSRSLYAALSPAGRSGEFFGLFSVMAKFSAVLGPLFFVAAVALFGNSRPALLGVFLFFLVGGWLLARVDVEEGAEVARRADAGFSPS